jgi:hypothetical protein
MVSFESLAARRSDPSGSESRLIPLLLRPTDLPDWIRGLIPIDWTDSASHQREWRKLLKVLGAKKRTAAPPAVTHSDAVHVEPRFTQDLGIGIISVRELISRDGAGMGFELLIANSSRNPILITSIELSGWRKVESYGSNYMLNRVVYSVDLFSKLDASHEGAYSTKLHAETYEDDPNWAATSEGTFKFEHDTKKHHKLWEYALSVPTTVQVSPAERISLKVLLKRSTRKIIEEVTEGYSDGEHSSNITQDYSLSLRLEDGSQIRTPTDIGFLKLLANWE